MKSIRAAAITAANLTSNVPETLPLYSAGTSYAAGVQVRDDATNHAFESVAGSNLNHALTDTAWWLDLGPTNRWAMFDQVNGTATTSASGIDVTVQLTGRADGLALIDVVGQSVQITVSYAGVVAYDQTFSLVYGGSVSSWYEYFTEPLSRDTVFLTTDLPLTSSPTIRVQVTDTSGPVSIGSMVVGQTFNLGDTIYPAKAGIRDYSRIQADDLGRYVIVPRTSSRRQTLKVAIDSTRVDAVVNLLTQLRATPTVWVGSESYGSLISFGFPRDWSLDVTSPLVSYLTMEIEGLT